MSSVAVKNPETASRGPLDRLHVGIIAGVVYILGSLAIVFKLLPTLWWTTLALPPTAVATTLLILVGLLLAGGLALVGVRLLGPNPAPGVKAGIFTALVTLLGILFITRGFSLWFESLVYDKAAFPETWGIGLTAAVGVLLLIAAVRFLFLASSFGSKMVAFEEQGWFSATSFKRSQGRMVRRGTIVGILILASCGIYSIEAHNTLAGSGNWVLNIPFTGQAKVTAVNDAVVLFGSGEEQQVPFRVDLGTFRRNNAELKSQYVKIDDPGDSDFRKGQVVKKDQFNKVDESLRDKKDEREPTISAKGPEPATADISYGTLTLLPDVRYTLPILLSALALWFAWRTINVPMFGDFLIATEAELNKVSWTTKPRLIQDTIVVLITVLLFTVFLFVVDVAWGQILSWKPIGVIKFDEKGGARAEGE